MIFKWQNFVNTQTSIKKNPFIPSMFINYYYLWVFLTFFPIILWVCQVYVRFGQFFDKIFKQKTLWINQSLRINLQKKKPWPFPRWVKIQSISLTLTRLCLDVRIEPWNWLFGIWRPEFPCLDVHGIRGWKLEQFQAHSPHVYSWL